MAAALLEQAKQLLEVTQVIASHQAQLARLGGVNFNVFRLLRMEKSEVGLHSPFIAGLLDPRGSHGQGSAFLKMFLRQVECSPGDLGIDADRARVEAPHYIGPRQWKGTDSTGGSIDIFITDGARHISIENKIRHGEGDHQVDRYCNYKPESNFVLFLTPDGKKADTTKTNYKPISYRKHVVPWLEGCHKYCTDLPVLRESIKQYLVVVKKLTGGDPLMQETNEEFKGLLRKNMDAARLIYSHYISTRDEAVCEVLRKLAQRIQRELERDLESGVWEIKNLIEDNRTDRGLTVRNSDWPSIGCVKWQYKKEGDFEYGFLADTTDRDEIRCLLGERVGELSFRSAGYWAFLGRMKRFPNLENNMISLQELSDEQGQTTFANECARVLIDFIYACDRKFKESANRCDCGQA